MVISQTTFEGCVMEDLFRFAIVRPATAIPPNTALSLARASSFQKELTSSTRDPEPRRAMKAIAAKFASGSGMARSIDGLQHAAGFAAMRAQLGTVSTADDLAGSITTWFGKPADKLVADPAFDGDDQRSADSLIAIKLLPAEQTHAATGLADVIRYVSIVRRVAANDPTLAMGDELARAARRPLSLPPGLFPIPRNSKGTPSTGAPPAPSDVAGIRTHVHQLQETINELMRLDLSALSGDGQAQAEIDRDGVDGAGTRAGGATMTRRLAPMILKPAAVTALSPATQRVLSSKKIDLAQIPLDRVVSAVSMELTSARRALTTAEATTTARQVGVIGRTPVAIGPIAFSPSPPPGTNTLPSSHGTITSVGVADLLVVKQNLKRYAARDIAHVENVLKGENKKREHERSTTTEQLTLSETETVREQERELESTDRFEMKRAASETISETASLASGLTVSGSYGPTVDFEASVQGSMESARERSVEVASSYSREVTDRSRSKIAETVHQLRSLRIVDTVAERNEHGIDNVQGPEHVVGIYQWLEKVYEAQIFNYGLRALYDFTVPEPAAFAIHAMQSGFADATQVTKPIDFTITPAQIDESTYHGYVRDWEATGVTPPPEPFMTVTKTFRGGPEEREKETRGMTVDSAEQPILDGYSAMAATVVARWGHWSGDDDMSIKVTVGQRSHEFVAGDQTAWSTVLDGEVGTVAVAVRSWRTSSFTAAVEITCQRTARAMVKWQLETHAQLLQAYQQQRSAYEEKLKALRSRAGVEISGKNPAINREIERRELKKACLSILTDQHFDLFGAIATAADGIPDVDVTEAGLEGPYIRFFEQAFEWHNATYVFYPYFWGRRSTWVDRFQYDDTDPLFGAFLRAGAARVVVPVRPGFEQAIDHFMSTGEIWQGADPPPISSETYVPIIAELAEQLGAPGNEVAQGDPWDVNVPTSLVLLRADRSLPAWHKGPDGHWIPDES